VYTVLVILVNFHLKGTSFLRKLTERCYQILL
jgi:hypothetical protein